nr:hypothetical protein [Tanacetum cinerariifolium]
LLTPLVSDKITDEDQTVVAAVIPMFDMPQYRYKISATKVDSAVKELGIPLDLHSRIHPKDMTMDQLPEDAIGLYHQFLGIKRNHDFDVNDPLLDDDHIILDVRTLAEIIIDLRSVYSTLLFTAGLAIVWKFPGFCHIFKDTRGNVITMYEYLHFPFTANVVISTGDAIYAKEYIVQNTSPSPFMRIKTL